MRAAPATGGGCAKARTPSGQPQPPRSARYLAAAALVVPGQAPSAWRCIRVRRSVVLVHLAIEGSGGLTARVRRARAAGGDGDPEAGRPSEVIGGCAVGAGTARPGAGPGLGLDSQVHHVLPVNSALAPLSNTEPASAVLIHHEGVIERDAVPVAPIMRAGRQVPRSTGRTPGHPLAGLPRVYLPDQFAGRLCAVHSTTGTPSHPEDR
jgi:hypothetical protein